MVLPRAVTLVDLLRARGLGRAKTVASEIESVIGRRVWV
jgi:hypothetical protein